MSPWQALIAEKTRPNTAEYAIARGVDGVLAQQQPPKPQERKPQRPTISVDEWLRTLPPNESYRA
jgi:hypothetical protein